MVRERTRAAGLPAFARRIGKDDAGLDLEPLAAAWLGTLAVCGPGEWVALEQRDIDPEAGTEYRLL